jgi:hypothetical protein
MKFLFTIVLSALFGSSSIDGDRLEIDKRLPKDVIILNKGLYVILTGPSSSLFGKHIKYKGIDYSIAEDSDDLISFIRTWDTSFITPENIKVGLPYSVIKSNGRKEYFNPVYSYEVVLKSGWTALFMDNFIRLKERISDTCKILSLSKSRS